MSVVCLSVRVWSARCVGVVVVSLVVLVVGVVRLAGVGRCSALRTRPVTPRAPTSDDDPLWPHGLDDETHTHAPQHSEQAHTRAHTDMSLTPENKQTRECGVVDSLLTLHVEVAR